LIAAAEADVEHLVGVRQVGVGPVVLDVGSIAADPGQDHATVVRMRPDFAR
jgi:hypothetical protein